MKKKNQIPMPLEIAKTFKKKVSRRKNFEFTIQDVIEILELPETKNRFQRCKSAVDRLQEQGLVVHASQFSYKFRSKK